MNRSAIISPMMIGLGALGLVPAESRKVKPMPVEVLALVPAPVDNIIEVKKSVPDVERDTMPMIVNKVKRTLYHTKKLAAKLKGSSLHETVLADSKFMLTYIKYEKDDAEHEQIRSPRRTIHEGKGDCDCMAVLIGSLLANQKVKFYFRIAKYKNGSEWSHIYVVVPKDQSSTKRLTNRDDYYVIDPVTNKINYEAPKIDFKDYTMGLQYLDGLGHSMGHMGCAGDKCTCDKTPTIKKLRFFVPAQQVIADGKVPTEQFLKENHIPYTEGVENNSGYFLVTTTAGVAKVDTIITKDQAAALKEMAVKNPTPPTRDEKFDMLKSIEEKVRSAKPQVTAAIQTVKTTAADLATKASEAAKKNNNWIWLLLAAGGVVLLSTRSSKPKDNVAGLGALPAKPAMAANKRKSKKNIPLFKM